MSILNKMLRDLEQRQHDDMQAPTAGIAAGSERPLWLNALLILSFILLCFAVFAILTRPVTPVLPTTVNAEAAAVAPDIITRQTDAQVTDVPVIDDPATDVQATDVQATEAQTTDVAITDAATDASLQHSESQPATDTVLQRDLQTESAVSALAVTEDATTRAVVPRASEPKTEITPQLIQQQPVTTAQWPKAAQSQKATPTAGVQVERTVISAAQRASALQQQALNATQAGQLQRALQLWQQLQQLTPDDALVYLAQARLWLQLGQSSTAEQVLQQALQQQVVHADIQLLLAQQAASRAQWQQVDTLLPPKFALAEQPDYYGLKATALQQLGQPQAALHWFSQLIIQQPQQPRWWLGAAIAYDAQAQRQQAHLHYRQALQWGANLSAASRDYIQQRLAATE